MCIPPKVVPKAVYGFLISWRSLCGYRDISLIWCKIKNFVVFRISIDSNVTFTVHYSYRGQNLYTALPCAGSDSGATGGTGDAPRIDLLVFPYLWDSKVIELFFMHLCYFGFAVTPPPKPIMAGPFDRAVCSQWYFLK